MEKDKIIDNIDSFVKNNAYAENFIDVVPDDLVPDYLNVIAVEMNLNTIKESLENQRYRSKEMLMHDLQLIRDNCIEFNSEDNVFAKYSKNLYDNLKKVFYKILTYRLRSVSVNEIAGYNLIYRFHAEQQLQLEPMVIYLEYKEINQVSKIITIYDLILFILETRMNKRNPKKASPNRRNTRKRSALNYDEENKSQTTFKKPTPQKSFKASEEDEPSYSLRRSSRNRGNQPSYQGRTFASDRVINPKNNNQPNEISIEIEEVKTSRASSRLRKRDSKSRNRSIAEENSEYNDEHGIGTRRATRTRSRKQNYEGDFGLENDDEYEFSDYS